MAIELATAYVSIIPDTSKLAPGIKSALSDAQRNLKITPQIDTGSFSKSMRDAGTSAAQNFHTTFSSQASRISTTIGTILGTGIGKTIGGTINAGKWLDTKAFHAIGNTIGNALKVGILGAVTAVGVGIGTILYKGFQRIQSMDTAKVVLKAMGLDPAAIKSVMADVQKVVEGTPISLDKAFGAAANFIATGVKQGPELTRILTDAADLAGAFAAPFENVVDIFSQIRANAGVMTGEMEARFRDLNIPIAVWVQETKDITAEMYADLRAKNQITLDDIEAAIEQHAPGMAKALGDTIQGAGENLVAAMSRLGQNMLAALFGGDVDDASKTTVDAIKGLTDQLDNISAWVRDNAPDITRVVGSIGDGFISAGANAMRFLANLKDLDAKFNDLLATIIRVQKIGAVFFGPIPTLLAQQMDPSKLNEQADAEREEADALRESADAVDAKGEAFRRNREEVAQVLEVTEALKGATVDLDRANQQLVVKSPTPEQIESLEDFGAKLKPIEGTHDFVITAKDEEAKAKIEAFVKKKWPDVVITTDADTEPARTAATAWMDWANKQKVNIAVEPKLDAWDRFLAELKNNPPRALIQLDVPPGFQITPGGNQPPANMPGNFGPDMGNTPSPTGGLLPNAVAGQNRYQSWGLRTGGYNATVDQPWDEHQTGQALDVSVPSGAASVATGNQVAVDALKDPNVQYVIWQQKQYYPDGRIVPMEDRGSPTENHMDHVHIRYRQKGGSISGSGSGDIIPALLEPGEHVLTRRDVAALGGQRGVYALRNMLQAGGDVQGPWWGTGNPDTDPKWWWNWPNIEEPQAPYPKSSMDVKPYLDVGGRDYPGYVKYKTPNPYTGTGQFNPNMLIDTSAANFTRDSNALLWLMLGMGGKGNATKGFQAGGEVTDEIAKRAQELGVSPQEYMAMAAAQPSGPAPGPGGDQGSDVHRGTGVPPGPSEAGIAGGPLQPADETSGRTPGFVPAGAGTTSIAGTSFVAGLLNLGNEAVAGLIDQGAQAAQAAISAAVTGAAGAGSFGAGAAAGPAASAAASYPIQLAATEAKRAVSYGFQMASIGADALIEQFFGPIGGPPRWIGYDYTQFLPHINTGDFGISTLEKAFTAGQEPGQQPGGPVSPEHMPGAQLPTGPVPPFGQPPEPLPSPTGPAPQPKAGEPTLGENPAAPPPGGGGGAPQPQPPPPEPQQPPSPFNPLNLFGFDQGGWWQPGQTGVNMTRQPEAVLSAQQWEAITSNPAGDRGNVNLNYHVTVADVDEFMRRTESQRKLDMMRYAGRP